MANRTLTKKLLSEIKKHKEAMEQLDDAIEAMPNGWKDIDLAVCLEEDFGPDARNKIMRLDADVTEAVLTSGTFNKMIIRQVRHALRETPKEQYKLTGMVTGETRGECEGRYRDWGVFSDIKVKEVCELEAGPLWGVGTDYMDHPNGKQVSAGLAWTREALCADPNGYLMAQVPKLRDAHDEWKEDRLIDAAIGYTPTYDRSGTLWDTFYEEGSATPFVNSGPWVNASGIGFTCGADLDEVRAIFHDMVDEVHGRRIYTDTNNMNVITSWSKARSSRPVLLSTEVRCDEPCDSDNQTCTYIMTGDTARGGMTVNVTDYDRFVDKIVERWGVTAAAAAEWMLWTDDINAFLGWVYQIAPEITRCPISGDDCMRRIVAKYTSLSKGYAYIKDPHRAVMLTGSGSTSE